MAIPVSCEHCGTKFQCASNYAGYIIRCTTCQKPFAIPKSSEIALVAKVLDSESSPSKTTMRSKVIAFGIAAVATFSIAILLPWLALILGFFLTATGIGYFLWPEVRRRVSAILPSQRQSQHFALVVAALFYGLLLVGISQSQIRARWRFASVRTIVARQIKSADQALAEGRAEEVLQICKLLDSQVNSEERVQVSDIRSKATAIQKASQIKEANSKVAELSLQGHQRLILKDLAGAESMLRSALDVPLSNELSDATQLANSIAAERITLASELRNQGHLDRARQEARKALSTPAATDFEVARQLSKEISTRQLELLVATANEQLVEGKIEDADATVTAALRLPDLANTDDATALTAAIRKARVSFANKEAAPIVNEAIRLIDSKEYDKAETILTSAKPKFPQATIIDTAINSCNVARDADAIRAKLRAKRQEEEAKEARLAASKQASNKSMAWVMAKQLLLRYLKSPSTADFGSVFRGEYQDPKTSVKDSGGGKYEVSGWVDAQNSFGATIRSHFFITIKDNGDDSWSVIGEPLIVAR